MSPQTIQFQCAGCGKKLQVAAAQAGKNAKCPGCGMMARLPAPADLVMPPLPNLSVTIDSTPQDASSSSSVDSSQTLASRAEGERGDSNQSGKGSDAAGQWDFLAPPQGPDEIGRLGGYRILRVLGSGGMGVVFYAEDLRLRRPLALKVLLPRTLSSIPFARERFLREARATAALEHDNIVTIYQVDEDRGFPYIAMQMLRGESLEKRLKRSGRLPLPEALRIARQVALGLIAAHARGLVHRDIKPSNIWLEENGRVKLLDFGLALDSGEDVNLTQTGAIVGTPAYMSPEQATASHDVDHRTDLFSLGCILYRMSTGKAPFAGSGTMSILLAIQTHAPEPPSSVDEQLPPAFSGLVMQLLAKQPERRPKSAQHVVERIQWVEEQLARQAALTGNAETVTVPAPAVTPPAPRLAELERTSFDAPGKAGAAPIPAALPPLSGGPSSQRIATPASPVRPGDPPRSQPVHITVPVASPGLALPDLPPTAAVQRSSRLPRLVLWGVPALLLIGLIALVIALPEFFGLGGGPVDNLEKKTIAQNGGTDKKTETSGKSPTTDKKTTAQVVTPIVIKPKPVPNIEVDPVARVFFSYGPFKKFGVSVIGNPNKRLTWDTGGKTNSLQVRTDGQPLLYQFGSTTTGQWLPLDEPGPGASPHLSRNRWETVFNKIRVTQALDVIPGKQPLEVERDKWRWPLDTCLAAYLVENKDTKPHSVGLRLVLDTMIGDNDGAPFAVPGLPGLIIEGTDLKGQEVPPFLQALENLDLQKPKTVAQLGLKLFGFEPPGRVSLTAWQEDLAVWELPVKKVTTQDSCVVLYWEDKLLQPEEKRYLGFTYGLGHLLVGPRQKSQNQIGVTVSGSFRPQKEFSVLAYVHYPVPGQKLKLTLDPGLDLVKCEAEQEVPQGLTGSTGLVTWTVRAAEAGQYSYTVHSGMTKQEGVVFITEAGANKNLKQIFE